MLEVRKEKKKAFKVEIVDESLQCALPLRTPARSRGGKNSNYPFIYKKAITI